MRLCGVLGLLPAASLSLTAADVIALARRGGVAGGAAGSTANGMGAAFATLSWIDVPVNAWSELSVTSLPPATSCEEAARLRDSPCARRSRGVRRCGVLGVHPAASYSPKLEFLSSAWRGVPPLVKPKRRACTRGVTPSVGVTPSGACPSGNGEPS